MTHETTRCEAVQSLLIERHSGSFSPASQIIIDEHLDQCETCRKLADWDARITANLRAGCTPCPAASLAKSVRGKIGQRRRRLWVSGFASAAMVLVAVALIAIQPSRELSVVEVHQAVSRPVAAEDLRELAGLFEPPPVDSLDVLSRQQNGYVAALNRMGKE